MAEPTRDEMAAALMGYRDRQLADLFTLIFGMAAECHPEVIRAALANLFDLSVVEQQIQRVAVSLSQTMEQAAQARELLGQVHLDLEELERRVDAIRFNTERLEERITKGAVAVTALAKKFNTLATRK